MKMSEYAAKHENDGKKIETDSMVSAQSLVGEIFGVIDVARIEKTKFGNPGYLFKIQDGGGFFATSSITRQLDRMISEGVTMDDIKGCRYTITKNHIDEHTDPKTGKHYDATDFLRLEYIEDIEEEEASE